MSHHTASIAGTSSCTRSKSSQSSCQASRPVCVVTEYEKNPELKKCDVEDLMEWVDNQPHLPKISELEAILFIQSCQFDLQAARVALDNYYTLRTKYPEYFMNRNPHDKDLIKTMNMIMFAPLPKKTPEGYTIFIARLMDTDPSVYNFVQQVKLSDMVFSAYLHQNGTMKGLKVILDMEGGSFRHLMKVGISQLKLILQYVQEAIPVKLIGVHYIHINSFLDKVMYLIKPFLKKEVLDLIHIHNKITTLYEFIPLECLPVEFGGVGVTLPELHEESKRLLTGAVELFRKEELMKVDESRRPSVTKLTTHSKSMSL